MAHLLRNLGEIEASKTGRAVCFSRDVTALLRKAMALQKEKLTLSPEIFDHRAADLETCLDALIDEKRRMTDPDNVRFAKRLRKHRPHLLRFLYVEGYRTQRHPSRAIAYSIFFAFLPRISPITRI
ncbi:MAG: hypothetical protein GY803_25285 [Chloroflexi bacterium]|nr:hypothetical protein [Chloroflexota bacterium]